MSKPHPPTFSAAQLTSIALSATALFGCAAKPLPAVNPPLVTVAFAIPATIAPAQEVPPEQHTVTLSFPPPLTETPLPITRSFSAVALPGIKSQMQAIGGQGSNDVWLVSNEVLEQSYRSETGYVYQLSGTRLKKFGHPCGAVNLGSVVASKNDVVLVGYRSWSRGVWPPLRMVLTQAGKFECDYKDRGYTAGITTSSADGEYVWQLTCVHDVCSISTPHGPTIPFPAAHESGPDVGDAVGNQVVAFFMRSLDDGWMVRVGASNASTLLRWNGASWVPLSALDNTVAIQALWADAEGNAWLLGRKDAEEDDPANVLIRYQSPSPSTSKAASQESQGTFTVLPVPKDFGARMVTGTGPKDVWFMGEKQQIYQWDGTQLRVGTAPFEVDDTWTSQIGEVWVVGGPKEETKAQPKARVAKLPAPSSLAPTKK